MPDTDAFDDERDETSVPLRAMPARFRYLYDFGDGWEHEVEVIGASGERPGVVAEEGPCPPEDVGGPPGYADFLETVANPEHHHMIEWAGTWNDTFDLSATDLLVQQTVWGSPGPGPPPARFDQRRGQADPGGRLPSATVRHVQDHYPDWYPLGRPASVEEDLLPLAALHDLLREVGLLRLHKGILVPTRAAGDDTEAVRRLRSWFGPTHGFTSILTTDVLALLVANGPDTPQDLAGRLLGLLGDRWITSQGQRLDHAATLRALHSLELVLVGLDLIQTSKGLWTAGPSAQWLLPRATALAHLSSR